jgi:hypothetical protein
MYYPLLGSAPRDLYILMFSIIAYLFTPWCRIFFAKLIVTQLVKKQPLFLMEPEG